MADEINSKVVTWAHGKVGQQVGRGECWDLIDRALRAAGARSATTTGRDDDYAWGRLIRLEELSPGDILRFRNVVITTKIDRVIKLPDGSAPRWWRWPSCAHRRESGNRRARASVCSRRTAGRWPD